jgi:hypothetical protein
LIPEGYTYEDCVFESSSSEDEVIVVAREVRLVNVCIGLCNTQTFTDTALLLTYERGMHMHAHTQHAGKSICCIYITGLLESCKEAET